MSPEDQKIGSGLPILTTNQTNMINIEVKYSEEDECYIAKCDKYDRPIMAHADSESEALREMAMLIDDLDSLSAESTDINNQPIRI